MHIISRPQNHPVSKKKFHFPKSHSGFWVSLKNNFWKLNLIGFVSFSFCGFFYIIKQKFSVLKMNFREGGFSCSRNGGQRGEIKIKIIIHFQHIQDKKDKYIFSDLSTDLFVPSKKKNVCLQNWPKLPSWLHHRW